MTVRSGHSPVRLVSENARRGRPPGRTGESADRKRRIVSDESQRMGPATVRQIYYQCVAHHGAPDFPKTEDTYKMCSRYLVELRLSGAVPWENIVDNSRSPKVRQMYGSVPEALGELVGVYAQDPWLSAPCHVQVFCEKEGLTNVLWEVTSDLRVPLYACGGYSSVTLAHDCAELLGDDDRPAYLFYVGDFDPTGIDIDRSIEEHLRYWAPDADITFERLAVTPKLIVERDLFFACRETKTTDKRAQGEAWQERSQVTGGQSVEVEALEPQALREIVRDAVERVAVEAGIDYEELNRIEAAERSKLKDFARKWK